MNKNDYKANFSKTLTMCLYFSKILLNLESLDNDCKWFVNNNLLVLTNFSNRSLLLKPQTLGFHIKNSEKNFF